VGIRGRPVGTFLLRRKGPLSLVISYKEPVRRRTAFESSAGNEG
jgi:hypothetical protein